MNSPGNRFRNGFRNTFRDRPVGRATVTPTIVAIRNSGTAIAVATGSRESAREPNWARRTAPWYGNAGLLTLGQAARIGGWTR